ncbi:hypothetical protein COCVIDRAFT_83637, partial [Bipolaris victoriae FI3]
PADAARERMRERRRGGWGEGKQTIGVIISRPRKNVISWSLHLERPDFTSLPNIQKKAPSILVLLPSLPNLWPDLACIIPWEGWGVQKQNKTRETGKALIS